MKRILYFILLSVLFTVPVHAATSCHDLVMSYVREDQDKPTKPGEKLFSENLEDDPVLLDTTGYYRGSVGSHGDKMRPGYVAYTPGSYGFDMELYKAVEQEDGSYSLGEYIGRYEVKDTGYGRETGSGKSTVRKDKGSRGTIESGLSVDVYHYDLTGCREWMKETNGRVFAVIIPDVKG